MEGISQEKRNKKKGRSTEKIRSQLQSLRKKTVKDLT